MLFNEALRELDVQTKAAAARAVKGTGYLSRGAASEWASRVTGFVSGLRDKLLAEVNGVPFYQRHPETAEFLLRDGRRHVQSVLADLQSAKEDSVVQSFSATSFEDVVISYIDQALEVLVASMSKAIQKSPMFGGLVALALLGLGLYATRD